MFNREIKTHGPRASRMSGPDEPASSGTPPALRPRAVLASLLAVGALSLGTQCSSDDGNTSLLRQAIKDVCRQVERCAEVRFSAAEMQECRRVGGALGLVVPDPESFSECVKELDCDELLEVEYDQAALYSCIDLDPTTVRCGEEGLLACTNAGYCSEIDCEEACKIVGTEYDSCGESDEHPYEVCRCRE